MIVNIIEFFRARLKATIRVCLAVLAALVVWDALFVSKEHVHTFVERIPGFWAAFGFVACVVIIIVSKWFGHLGIMTREDYYDD
ncbi:hypothetical protein [uncultured Desulfovibrio sp.]|uniref:hypothetical protein n=1 Tax=uncultured Desulfovibrio sp. TaxID=167968 RepID=UPI002612E101|nr:hypothetical protein [uncultured Desulfovibrio sp.]